VQGHTKSGPDFWGDLRDWFFIIMRYESKRDVNGNYTATVLKTVLLVSVFYFLALFSPFTDRNVVNVQTAFVADKSIDSRVEEAVLTEEENDLHQEQVIDRNELPPEQKAFCTKPLRYIQPPRDSAVLLASYPGSGNTWVRHLIQVGLRRYTGSAYNDKSLIEAFPAEGVKDGSVVVTKTHFPCKSCWRFPKKPGFVPVAKTGDVPKASATVYIVRSPFDALLAEFKRLATDRNHTGTLDQAKFEVSIVCGF